MLRLALTPRWLGFLAFVLVLATLFVGLSAWQADRARHKNDAVSAQDVETPRVFVDTLDAQVPMGQVLSDQRVTLTGEYLPEAQVLVEDRLHDGEAGFWIVTMFAPEGARMGESAQLSPELAEDTAAEAASGSGEAVEGGAAGPKPIAVPVVRGWVADAASAADAPAPTDTVEMSARLGPVEGAEPRADLPEGHVRAVSTATLVNMFSVYSYSGILFPENADAAVAPGASAAVEPVVLEREESGGVDLQSAIYALEWIFFAGFALYIWFQLLRDAHRKQQEELDGGPVEYVVVKESGERSIHEPRAEPERSIHEPRAEPERSIHEPRAEPERTDPERTETDRSDPGPHPESEQQEHSAQGAPR